MHFIDLNCDMGEGCGNDAELMDFVSSVNIACGVHAGDTATMQRAVETALKKGVVIGAHPGFPDRESFGRVAMNLPYEEIYDLVTGQIVVLSDICKSAGAVLRHVKPHGALYNQSAKDAELAYTISNAVRHIDENLILVGLSGSDLISEAKKLGLKTASEAFADRTYHSDGSLTPRNEPNALIGDAHTAVTQVLQIITNETVTATGGQTLPIIAETICIHGDGLKALEFAEAIYHKLIENGVIIKAING